MRLALLILLAVAASAPAQTPEQSKTRMRLQLELELQKAKAVTPAVPIAAPMFKDYAAALAETQKTGKPLFVAVGMDCSGLCPSLRPDMVTCHVDSLAGVPAKCCLLGMPHAGRILKLAQWNDRLPTDRQVREQVTTFRQATAPPVVQPAICWADGT